MRDWARYWRGGASSGGASTGGTGTGGTGTGGTGTGGTGTARLEAMHAHFTRHVYHRHSHESYSFGVTEAGAQTFTCRGGHYVSSTGLVMAFNPDDPHDGHADDDAGFTYRMIHIWPEDYAGLLDGSRALPLPLFREPVIDDPDLARALLRLHAALTGSPAGASSGSPAGLSVASASPGSGGDTSAGGGVSASGWASPSSLSGPSGDGGAFAGGASELVRAERLMAVVRIADRHASRPSLLRRDSPFSGFSDFSDLSLFPDFSGYSGSGHTAATREIAARGRRRIHDGEPSVWLENRASLDNRAAPDNHAAMENRVAMETRVAPDYRVTMEDLAAAAGCSRYAAYRAFSAVFGMAPSDYQRQLRVRAARRLLASGVTPAAAAAGAGFADQAHLTRWFRRYYGVTPGAYQAAA